MNVMIYSYGLLCLLVLSIFEVSNKDRIIPSVLTTTYIFISLLLSQNIYLAALSGILAWIMVDMDFLNGMSAVKVFVGTSMLFHRVDMFGIFVISFMVLVGLYKIIRTKYLNTSNANVEILPMYFITFALTYIMV